MRAVLCSTIPLALLTLIAVAQGQTQMSDRVFGQVVNIEIFGTVDEIQRDQISRRVPELMDRGEYVTRFHTRDGVLIARVAPVADVKAFAARIDFGKVTRISGRTIYVSATPVPAAGTAAASPLNRALAGLKSSDVDSRESALEQLAQMRPLRQRRNDVLRALAGPVTSADVRMKALAIEAVGVWGTHAEVPVLLKLLDTTDYYPRRAVIKALGRLKHPAAIEPIARRLCDELDSSEAVEALVAFGPAAEQAALHVLAGDDSTARAGACKVLEKVGTRHSVAALKAAKNDPDNWVRSAASRALKSLSRRLTSDFTS
jgi:hypothetical protein